MSTTQLIYNRPTDNYLFTIAEARGLSGEKLRLRSHANLSASTYAYIDICNNGSIDLSGTGSITIKGNAIADEDSVVLKAGTQIITGQKTFTNANVIIGETDGNQVLDIASHDLVDGGLKLAGTLVTSSASELNILDGVTSSTTELNLLDGSTAGSVVNSKAVVYGSGGEVNATKLQIGGSDITSSVAELNLLDGATAGTVVASKALIADSNKDIGSIRNLTLEGALSLAGNLKTANNTAQIPVTYSTFTLVTTNLNTDLSNLGNDPDITTYQDATNWTATRTVLSGHSYIKMEFKVNFISSPEFDQTLSFKVLRSLNAGGYTEVFEDTEIGSNMGVTIRGVYNGTFIDDLGGNIAVSQNVVYKLQVKRNKAAGDTIVTPFGIVPGGNYIFLQELYQPNA